MDAESKIIKNLPSNYDHISNKLYPIHYDFTMFYDNPDFINLQNHDQTPKLSAEQIPIANPELIQNTMETPKQESPEVMPKVMAEINNNIEYFSDINDGQMGRPLIIEPILPEQSQQVIDNNKMSKYPTIQINLYYLIFFCIFITIILGGIIICKKKNIV